jgi:uncharacterized membrane protein YoaK (UPF0700 family)
VADAGSTGDARDAGDRAAAGAGGAPATRDGTAPATGPGAAEPGPGAPTAVAEAAVAGFVRSLVADPGFGPLYGLLLTLTVVTGVVDAVSILALGRVFVANMTGNVVFAAFAVVGAPGFSLSASLFALAGFLVGAYVGGTLIARYSHDRSLLLRAGCAAELAFAAAALALAAASGDPGATHGTLGLAGAEFGSAVTDAVAALLAIALGVQNAVARKLAVPDMTTTVLTMTLTGVGADLRAIFGEGGRVRGAARAAVRAALGRRLLAVATMIVGAAAGASLTLRVSPVSALALAASLLALVTAWVTLATRRPAGWRAFPSPRR